MPSPLTHAAINADDVDAARRFYESVYGWRFTPWGPPGFLRCELEHGVVAIQRRRELVPGVRTTGFECTMAVDDVQAAIDAAAATGGRVVMEPTAIPGVGELVFLADPSGTVSGAMRYGDPQHVPRVGSRS
jgi:predicted enzyme related to lactoylglutathione lyase